MREIDTQLFRALVEQIGEDPSRGGLRETPERTARAWEHWTSGYDVDPAQVLKCFEDGAESYDELVFQGNITFFSHCEHHLAPFFGVVHIGYIPTDRVVGLSKLSRLVDIFAHRLQVQERMTRQIADALAEHLRPLGVAVVVSARHLCMESRGIRRVGTRTMTSAVLGALKDRPEARAEFMNLVGVASAESKF